MATTPKLNRKPKPEALPKLELAMQMTFYNEAITERFIELALKHGLHGHRGRLRQGTRYRYRVTVMGFKNRTAMANFTATWAALSMTRE